MLEQDVTNKVTAAGKEFITGKRSRSFLFLLFSFIIILAINSVLPLIEGEAHYTVENVEVTYIEYQAMKRENINYSLTYLSKAKMELYTVRYIENHPELSDEETVDITIPDNFKVTVHTDFFFNYPFWYISTGTSLLSSVLLFYSLFNFLVTKGKDKYKKYVELEEELNTATKALLDPVTFEPWMDNVFNYNRSVTQHKRNVKYSIEKLETRTSYRNKHRLRKYFLESKEEEQQKILAELELAVTPRRFSKKPQVGLRRGEIRYMHKRESLMEMLTPMYIYTYVTAGKVKYFKYIHPMFVYNGTNNIGRTVDSYSMIKSDAEKITSDAGAKVMFSLSITLIFSVLFTVTAVASIGQSPLWVVINILAKIAPLLLQVPLAIDYYNNFMEKHLITNLYERRAIGLRYGADMKAGVSVAPPVAPTPPIVPTLVEEPKKYEVLYTPVYEEGEINAQKDIVRS